jgi:argininosuccinate lyase
LAAPLVRDGIEPPAIAATLDRGSATTLMEWLIRRGVPQRTAHEIVGRLVRLAMDRGVRLADLKLDEFRAAHAELDESIYEILSPEQAVAAFVSYGSTAPDEVEKQIAQWKERLQATPDASVRPEPDIASAMESKTLHLGGPRQISLEEEEDGD